MAATFDFTGAKALVTGGANGIGLAIATAFAEAGAEVTVTGTRAAADGYDHDLGRFAYRQLIAEDDASVDALAEAVEACDVLVNNAGTAVRAPESFEPEGFSRNVRINLDAVYRLTARLRPKLAARKGCVVNVASMTSYAASPRIPGYGASKAAVLQLTQSLAALYAEEGIRVNAIAPGWIATKLTVPVRETGAVADPILSRTPMGRWGAPEEMAGTVLYLASPDLAGFVTGVTIPVDGGYSAA